jgi:hypothetical protein
MIYIITDIKIKQPCSPPDFCSVWCAAPDEPILNLCVQRFTWFADKGIEIGVRIGHGPPVESSGKHTEVL